MSILTPRSMFESMEYKVRYMGGVVEWVASRRGEPEVPSSSPAEKAADFSVIAEWLKITNMLF